MQFSFTKPELVTLIKTLENVLKKPKEENGLEYIDVVALEELRDRFKCKLERFEREKQSDIDEFY